MDLMSYYSNWSTLDSDMSTQHAQTELVPELLGFENDLTLSNTYIDQLFLQQNDHSFCYSSDGYNCVYPSSDNLNTLAPEPFELIDSKRQKTFDFEDVNFSELFYPGFVPNPCVIQDFRTEVTLPPLPDFPTAPPRSGSSESVKRINGGGSLSAQSIAARQRRRKITEKTQELGKLIPGGQRMNTAEMFQAAYKYIKFLQTQVGILEFMGSYEKNGETAIHQSEDLLTSLLESPLIQEKLYSIEKCLVPGKFVETLATDGRIESKSQVLKECKKLIPKLEH
ncbi:transcription factor bHLH52 [Olea europaea subsp. europaea]|uniref:Transcription factor bHLH52 n=1 Tax=Olea europaea subsp. europaea TaxID=158383 RepID=A0A8S0VPR4_OLEEU|nr:transcription factor bHLH52 [Olea europaea subsp. europaea]